jgi:hypothetical protein
MTIEFTAAELEILEESLKDWAASPLRDWMSSSMIRTLVGVNKARSEEEQRKQLEAEMSEAQNKSRVRERKALMLRAKIAQALEGSPTSLPV